MKHLFRGSKLIVIVIMLSVITGCAIISGGQVPKTRLTVPTAEDQTKPTIIYKIYANEGDKLEFLEEFGKSRHFKEITEGHSADADIELVVFVDPTNSIENLSYGVTTTLGLVGGVLPAWATDHYKVRAQVKNKKGLEREYVLNDSATAVSWFPFVVFLPFTYDGGENVRRNIYRNIIQQMYEDGFIEES